LGPGRGWDVILGIARGGKSFRNCKRGGYYCLGSLTPLGNHEKREKGRSIGIKRKGTWYGGKIKTIC